MTADNTITIGLLWHSLSSDNLGVGALTVSQMALWEQAARSMGLKVRFVLYGTSGHLHYPPAQSTWEQGPRYSFRRMVTGHHEFDRAVARCDVVLDIGEGDSFASIYGAKRMTLLLGSKWAVLRNRIPLVLSPQTIGPFDGWLGRAVAGFVMRRCDRVFARDTQSRQVLHQMGLDAVADEAIDVAFALPFEPPAPRHDGLVHVGLNVSGLLFAGGYSRNNQFGLTLDYAALVRRLLAQWCAMPGVQVHLIAHVLASALPVDDDRVAIRQLAAEFPQAVVAPSFASPSEAKSYIAGMHFMTGARMHACIAALSAGVAVVPLAYSRKFNGLLQSLEYPHMADGRADTLDVAFNAVMRGFEQRAELSQQAQRSAIAAQHKLDIYSRYICKVLAGIRPGLAAERKAA